MAPRNAVSCSETPLVSMMSHLTGSSALAFSMPRAEASMKERSPNGLGVISAQVNFAASVAGASVAGVAPQAVRTIDATTKRLRAKSKFLFISSLLGLIGLRNFVDRFINLWRGHLLNPELESLL